MKTKATNVRLALRELPQGVFKGFWSGYVVRFETEGEVYNCDTEHGVRGINVPCTVTIEGEEVYIDVTQT